MTTEAAKIIIDAEDLASKKFEAAARNAEKNIKAIKETGSKAKASTEFFGTLANTLGGSQLGSYAGELGQLTERVSAFSEVSKAGGAGALAFKAGLAGVVGVLSFKAGKAIGDFVFGTKELERQLQRSAEAARDLDKAMLQASSRSFTNQQEDIELIRDPEEKRAAAQALLQRLEKDVTGVTAQLKASQQAVDEWSDAWQVTSQRKEMAKMAEAELEQNKARLEQIKEQRDEVRRLVSERTAENELIKQQNALKDKSESFLESLREEIRLLSTKKEDMAAFEASRNTFGAADQSLAEQLIRERELLKEKAEAEKLAAAESDRLAAKATADAERIAAIRDNEIARLKEQRIELEQGAEAARAFALEQQGLDAVTAKRLAAEATALEMLRDKKADEEKLASEKPKVEQKSIQAVESRLLTRGASSDPLNRVAANSDKTVKALQDLRKDVQNFKPVKPLELRVGGI